MGSIIGSVLEFIFIGLGALIRSLFIKDRGYKEIFKNDRTLNIVVGLPIVSIIVTMAVLVLKKV
jgi:hypothetical protein